MKKSGVDIGSVAIAGAIVFAVYKLSGLFKKQDPSADLDLPGGGSLPTLDANLIGQRLYNAMSGLELMKAPYLLNWKIERRLNWSIYIMRMERPIIFCTVVIRILVRRPICSAGLIKN